MRPTLLYILAAALLSFAWASDAHAAARKAERAEQAKQDRCSGAATAASIEDYSPRSELTWTEKMRLKKLRVSLIGDGVDEKTVDALFTRNDFGLYDATKKLFKHNPEKKADSGDETYKWYSECLGSEKRVRMGRLFMEKQSATLAAAEKKYGVDRRYIVSILGVESTYATDEGNFDAVNALVSQYVLAQKRRKFGYRQLKELIDYSKRTGIPLRKFTSSYAGAIGCAQFIPSSLNYYFVGRSGKIEKANPFNTADCIYSIAYYLKKSRWDKSQNGKTPTKGSRNWKAIRAYNHSDAYTRFIIEMAESFSR